jgi:GNAT superfamily N-acetyltransferase
LICMDVQIQKAIPENFEDIFRLFGQLWPNKELHKEAMLAVYSKGIESSNDHYLCALANGKVIGFCAIAFMNNFWQEGRIAYLYAMIVDESFRSNGIGKSLIEEAYHIARKQGCKKIELDSGFPREKAHTFYEQQGYAKRAFLFSKDVVL